MIEMYILICYCQKHINRKYFQIGLLTTVQMFFFFFNILILEKGSFIYLQNRLAQKYFPA